MKKNQKGTKKPKALRTARCPGCHKEKDVDKQRGLIATDERYHERSRMGPGWMRDTALKEYGSWFWACDACFSAKRALVADFEKQAFALGTPFAAYVDRPFRCSDCGADACFTAKEQKHWFETLQFLLCVYPKQCPPCRAKRRRKVQAQKDLAEALHGLDADDPTQLDAVARLYDEIGATEKATLTRKRAANRRKRTKQG